MALEIEKKYLVNSNVWFNLVEDHFIIKQGYFIDSDGMKKRIRLIDDKTAILGTKLSGVETNGFIAREENEHEIDFAHGLTLFNNLDRFIKKHRHLIPISEVIPFEVLKEYPNLHDLKIEVDVFLNLNKELTMAEIEVNPEQIEEFNKIESFLPSWFSQDVTLDESYSNSKLIKLTEKLKDENPNKKLKVK